MKHFSAQLKQVQSNHLVKQVQIGGKVLSQLISQPAQKSILGLLIDGQSQPTNPFQFQLIIACQISMNKAKRANCKVKQRFSKVMMFPQTLRDASSKHVQETMNERIGKNLRAVLERQNTNRKTYTQNMVLKKKSEQESIGNGSRGYIILLIMQQDPKARRKFIPKLAITQNKNILRVPTPFCLKRLQMIVRQRCTHPQLSFMHLSQNMRKTVQVKISVYRMKSPIKMLNRQSKKRAEQAQRSFRANQGTILIVRNCRKLTVWRQITSGSCMKQQVRNSSVMLSLALVMLFFSLCSSNNIPNVKKDSLIDQITIQLMSISLGKKQENIGDQNCLSGKMNLSKVIPCYLKYQSGLLSSQDSCIFSTSTIKGSFLTLYLQEQSIRYQHFVVDANSMFIIVFSSNNTNYQQVAVWFAFYVLFYISLLLAARSCFQTTQSSRH